MHTKGDDFFFSPPFSQDVSVNWDKLQGITPHSFHDVLALLLQKQAGGLINLTFASINHFSKPFLLTTSLWKKTQLLLEFAMCSFPKCSAFCPSLVAMNWQEHTILKNF